MKKFSIFTLMILVGTLSASACSNKNNAGNGGINPGDGSTPPPGIQDNSQQQQDANTQASCDAASPKVIDYFTSAPLTVDKSFNRYEKYVGHDGGLIKAYAHAGKFTAYNKYGNTVHVTKEQSDLGAAGIIITDHDVKSPIQSLAFAKIGEGTKLLVGTRHNLQVYSVTDAGFTLEKTSNAIDGILNIEVSGDKTFLINNKGDVYFTPNDNCFNASFSRIYAASSDRDNLLKHDYVAHKVKKVGDKVFIMTRNRDEFDLNMAQMASFFYKSQFYFWNNKVLFVNLADKSVGKVKLTTPSTPDTSASDISVSDSKLYIAVNEFPASTSLTNLKNTMQTCVATATPLDSCSGMGASLTDWFFTYLFGNAGVLVHDAAGDVANNTPIFNAITPDITLLGAFPINTGFFYSPRITVANDTLYMTGMLGMKSLPNLSTGNTLWQDRLMLSLVAPSNVEAILPVSLESWEGAIRRIGLNGLNDYNFTTDTNLGSADSDFFNSMYYYPTEQGRGENAKNTDFYQWDRRRKLLDSADTTLFNTGPGMYRGFSVSEGDSYTDDRYMSLKLDGANYALKRFKPDTAAAEAEVSFHLGALEGPLYSVLQLMSNLRAGDAKYSFAVFFDPAGPAYKIKAVNNFFTSASPASEVISSDASGAGVSLSGFPIGFQKVVTTADSYILYISMVNVGAGGSVFNVDRIVISKDSVAASLTAPFPAPVITDHATIAASDTVLYAMDADENNIYILDTHGVLTTKNASGSVVGSPINAYNFSSGEMLISIPPSIYVKNNKAYMNGVYIGMGSIFKMGMGFAIADLATGQSKTFPEAQYLSINGSKRLIGTSYLNENGTELFEF